MADMEGKAASLILAVTHGTRTSPLHAEQLARLHLRVIAQGYGTALIRGADITG